MTPKLPDMSQFMSRDNDAEYWNAIGDYIENSEDGIDLEDLLIEMKIEELSQ